MTCDAKAIHKQGRTHGSNSAHSLGVFCSKIKAKKNGVQFRAFKCNVSYKGINITGEINIDEN